MRPNVTRAAEGFDRCSFTVAEVLRMQDGGIISEDDIVERGPDEVLNVALLPEFSMQLSRN